MEMTDKTYQRVKWVVSVVMPAVGVLVGSLGKAWGWDQTDLAVTTIAAVTAFLGGTMLHSTAQFNKSEGADK